MYGMGQWGQAMGQGVFFLLHFFWGAGFAVLAVFSVVILWRCMRAHERLADSAREIAARLEKRE